MPKIAGLTIDVDPFARIVTIEGVRYSYEFFRVLGYVAPGTVLRVDRGAAGDLILTGHACPTTEEHF
jgi:hypothetical protein